MVWIFKCSCGTVSEHDDTEKVWTCPGCGELIGNEFPDDRWAP